VERSEEAEEVIEPAKAEPAAEIIEPPEAFVRRLGVPSGYVFADAIKEVGKHLAALTRRHLR
jgi:hypothetical protein